MKSVKFMIPARKMMKLGSAATRCITTATTLSRYTHIIVAILLGKTDFAKLRCWGQKLLTGKNVAVIGGGNTAMDSVRTARRMGAERAMLVYRRSEEEMPARIEEVKHAKEEGVEFMTLHNPIEYRGDETGRVNMMRLQKMRLGEPDVSGRRSPVPSEGAIEEIPVDLVIVSVGVSPNPLVPKSISGLEVSNRNTIVVDTETMRSSINDLYAGGDIVRGGATVILAMGDGRRAAENMHKALSNAAE